MNIYFFTILLIIEINGLKTWIPNTDISNKLNWDKGDIPKNCDNIHFPKQSDVTTFWDLKDVAISGLSLSGTGDIIFSHNIKIQFMDAKKCSTLRELTYIRKEVKSWLDPDNWKSDSENQWLPHTERVPCTGENLVFPAEKTFAIQLPSILVPIGGITFDTEVFKGERWSNFLQTELGFKLFKGPDNVRSLPWRNDIGCFDKKKCICSRSAYSIRDGLYKEASPHIFEQAVCLYAMAKCKAVECYSPIVPEGHCCGICGAIIKVEDGTKEGIDLSNVKLKVKKALDELNSPNELQTYVGRTKDENIQIVIVAENADNTIKSHYLANLIKRKFLDHKFGARISSRTSGLTLSKYMFNNISGAVFGTLFAVIVLFVSIFYFYIVLPKKKFQNLAAAKPFMFARFDNSLHEVGSEENLNINAEPSQTVDVAFDNPMYARKSEVETSDSHDLNPKPTEINNPSEGTTVTKEYSNPVYTELEKSDPFEEKSADEKLEEFTDIKL